MHCTNLCNFSVGLRMSRLTITMRVTDETLHRSKCISKISEAFVIVGSCAPALDGVTSDHNGVVGWYQWSAVNTAVYHSLRTGRLDACAVCRGTDDSAETTEDWRYDAVMRI